MSTQNGFFREHYAFLTKGSVLGIEDGEYHVFLTPEGDTQGLYVESRSAKSFIVREQQAGTTDITFSYRVAAKNKHRSRSQ
jgi:hypothetical protein